MKPVRQTTTTLLVLEALRRGDDFYTIADLVRLTGRSPNRVSAALHHLRHRHAVDVVIQQRTGFWFARPPEEDDRSRVLEEIAAEYTKKPGRRRILKRLKPL